jgi:hypothetical protein
MDETKATASLPGLDIELKRRVDAAEGAEYVSITLRAVPSIEAFGLAVAAFNPFTAPLMAWQSWAEMTQAFWRPFLPDASGAPRLPRRDAHE